MGMVFLLLIVLVTLWLAMRAGVFAGSLSPADSDAAEENDLFGACTRMSLLVLLCLIGLLVLGLMYGNVLGGAPARL
jgi:hypothetical protein